MKGLIAWLLGVPILGNHPPLPHFLIQPTVHGCISSTHGHVLCLNAIYLPRVGASHKDLQLSGCCIRYW